MCCLFGILDYQGRLSLPRRRQMLAVLARECEARGTDAAGIAYCVNRHMSVYKAPKPAHLVNFQPPARARFIMGHTRMATQGDEHCNYNNHPFKGRAGNTTFALAHNGVIHNDQLLKVQYQLPKTKIETDSYVAVQLLEQSGKLDFHSLRKMAEVMQGTFTFTVLDDKNNLYIVKGNNPICIYHFPREGFYIYASTKEILDQTATKLRLNRRHRKEIPLKQGEILKITPEGSRHVEQFQNDYLLQSSFNLYGWGGRYPYYPTYPTYPTHPSTTPDEEQPSYLEELMEFGESIGVMRKNQQLLLDAGYTWMDLEEMFYDPMLLDVCLRDAACPV